MTSILKVKTKDGGELELTPQQPEAVATMADSNPPPPRRRTTKAVPQAPIVSKTLAPTPAPEPLKLIVVPDPSPLPTLKAPAPDVAIDDTPSPLVVGAVASSVSEKGRFVFEYQTKLSAAERLLAVKFAGERPSDWEQKWSAETDGLRRLMRFACEALTENPTLGQDILMPPGSFGKVFSLRVDLELHQLMQTVRQPDETSYSFIKRLIQVGAKARPDIRDRFLN